MSGGLGLGVGRAPLAFPMQSFSFSRLSGSLEQAISKPKRSFQSLGLNSLLTF